MTCQHTLLSVLPGGLAGGLGALLLEVLEVHDLGHDEPLLEVRVDAPRRLRRLRAFLYEIY